MKEQTTRPTAEYVGLKVEVIAKMDSCSLVRFQERKIVVDTADLVFSRSLYPWRKLSRNEGYGGERVEWRWRTASESGEGGTMRNRQGRDTIILISAG
jgi:hypothetical protein